MEEASAEACGSNRDSELECRPDLRSNPCLQMSMVSASTGKDPKLTCSSVGHLMSLYGPNEQANIFNAIPQEKNEWPIPGETG